MSLTPVVNRFPAKLRRSASSRMHQAYSFPAPTLGVDSTQALANADPQTALSITNMFCRSTGLELRAGYVRHAGILPVTGYGVTLIPYLSAAGSANNKLFMAATDGNVYDVTNFTAGVSASVLTVAGATTPGEAYWVNFVNPAGSWLCVVFPGAGYWTFDGTTWVQRVVGVGIIGVNPTTFGYVFTYKESLCFIQTGTSRVWYLPTDAITGTVTSFDFGSMFTRGGDLSIGQSWTVDGGGSGGGMDDSLVLISSEGDVLIYGGGDLAATTFATLGRWFVGRLAAGRRCITRYGSDMLVLSERGVLSLAQVLRDGEDLPQTQVAKRINQILQPDLRTSLGTKYWELKILPEVNCLMINPPAGVYADEYAWAVDLTQFGASKMTNFPFVTMEGYNNLSYATDTQGNVWRLWSGITDGAVGAVAGTDVQANVQTSFVKPGDGFNWKRFLLVRAGFISAAAPGVQLGLNPDWSGANPALSPVFSFISGTLWDTSLWDAAVWASGNNTYKAWTGATGMGRYVSLTLAVKGTPGTVFTDWDCIVEAGGAL